MKIFRRPIMGMLKGVAPTSVSSYQVPGLTYGVTYANSSGSAPLAGGSGYVAGDLITLTGGGTITTNPIVSVDTVSSGAITAFHVNNPGVYTALIGSPATLTQSSTTGVGSGAQFSFKFAPLATDLYYDTTLNPELVIGYQAGVGRKGTAAIRNTMLGFQTGGAGGQTADGIGGGTGLQYSSAAECTFVGSLAGTQITTGNLNTFIGHNAGGHETTGSQSVYVGTDTGKWSVNCAGSTGLGAQSLKFVQNGPSNTAVGSNCFPGSLNITTNITGAANNGSNLIRLTVTATTSMATGDFAAVTGVTGTTEANGTWTITVVDATHVDLQGSTFTHAYVSGGSLNDFPTNGATRNTVVGQSILNSTTGIRGIARNIIVGESCAQNLTNATDNVLLGSAVAGSLSSGSQNVLIGTSAGTTATTSGGNVCIGYNSNVTAATGIQHTVVIGSNGNGGGAGARGGSASVVIGGQAGNANLTGANNVVIGFAVASTTLTTGTNNVLIGTSSNIDTAAAGTANTIAIGAGSTAVISATGCGTPSTSTTTIAGAQTVTGAMTPTGGVAAAGGFSVSPRLVHTGGYAGNPSTSAFTAQTPVTTEFYFAEVFVRANCTVTGVGVFNSATISGNMKVGLANSAGAIVATSVSTAMAGTSTFQRVAFTSTYAALGPATYYVCVFYDNATVRPNTHTVGNFGVNKSTSQTYATGFTAIAAPTTFTTALGPVATLY